MDNQRSIFKSVVKKSYSVESPDEIYSTIVEGINESTSGRPKPVYIEIPINYMGQVVEQKEYVNKTYKEKTKLLHDDVKKALEIIKESKRPILYLGYGVILSDAEDAVIKLA